MWKTPFHALFFAPRPLFFFHPAELKYETVAWRRSKEEIW